MEHEHNSAAASTVNLTIPVKGMHCASCAITIKKTLKKSDGVIDCDVNYGNEKVKIEFNPLKTTIQELSKKIETFGYSLDTKNISMNQEEHSNHAMHQMSDGTMMLDHEMKDHNGRDMKGMDHSAHLGIGQSKDDKLKELDRQRTKVHFVMPITAMIFVLMMWEIAAQSFSWFPKFFLPHELFQTISLILATIVLFWIGGEFLKEVGIFIKYRVANMYTLVGIGTLTAYIYSTIVVLFPQIKELMSFPDMVYFDVVIVVIGFIYLGKFMESRSKLLTGEAIEKLLNLQAKTALVERNGKEIEIPIDQVSINDIIIIKPGSKIPVDGIIIEGRSSIDESMITGEPIPVDKNIEDTVIGGTINKQGSFKFRATKIGSETVLSQIIKMVDEAQGSRASIQGLADRVSEVFVPAVLVIAVITLLGWLIIGSFFMPFIEALSIGILCFTGVLVIACPCALGLATPTAIIVGTGKGAENGILIKDAESLEKLYKINTIVTDKTGTITKGKPEVTDIIPVGNISVKDILHILSSLEKKSEHPLAEAIVNKAKETNIEISNVEQFEIIEGKGLKGKVNNIQYYAGNMSLLHDLNIPYNHDQVDELTSKGKTPVFFANDKEILAIIGIADTLKENAKDTVKALHKLGLKVIMLTGDNEKTAKYIASLVGIDEIIAEVLPQDKANKIKELQSKGLRVAMVGDGVNDAPALAQADVGIAMATGTDVAIESASITLLRGDFSKVLQAIKLSKFTIRAIKQNLFWAFSYNIVGIPLAAGLLYPVLGILLNPIFAGLAMALSSVSVVTNSLRLKSIKI
jgi:Cu+-exporting ATPase